MSRLDPLWWRQLPRLAAISAMEPARCLVTDANRHRAARRIELTGSRDYAPGDDYRQVDWYRCARHDELLTRQSVCSTAGPVHVLLDASQAMNLGKPTKFDVACRVAGALAYVALQQRCATSLTIFADGVVESLPATSDRNRWLTFARFLNGISTVESNGGLETTAEQLGRLDRRRGVLIVLSDMLHCDRTQRPRFAAGLTALENLGYAVRLVHLCDPGELCPAWGGDRQLIDAQGGPSWEGTITERALADYRRRVAGFLDDLDRYCRSHRVRRVRLWTNLTAQDLLRVALGLGSDDLASRSATPYQPGLDRGGRRDLVQQGSARSIGAAS